MTSEVHTGPTGPTDHPTGLYAAVRQALVHDVRELPGDQTTLMVPSCPEWSVKDVIAHVTGLLADIRDEVPPPLGSDEATSRQVTTRSMLSIAEVCDEWMTNAEGLGALNDRPLRLQRGLLADLVGHVLDLAEMDAQFSIAGPSTQALATTAALYASLLQARAADTLDIALTVAFDGQHYEPTAGTDVLALHCSPMELVRSVTGRRTRAFAEQLGWSGDPASLLDHGFLQYGPFQEAA